MRRPVWMIYGANGQTGRRIVAEAAGRGLRPVLAGRNAQAVRSLAETHDCPWQSFALRDPAEVARQLDGFQVVLNCAGPFSATARVMLEACLRAGVHYLDITGEIMAIEQAAARHAQALARGVMLLPAVGFDVVPSDCLAAMLAARLPGAKKLQLAFGGRFRPSRGTARTMLEGLSTGAWVRKAGRLRRVTLAHKMLRVPLPGGPQLAVTIPWGDVATAWHTTGIPEIEVYCALDAGPVQLLRMLRLLAPVLRLRAVRAALWRMVPWFLAARDQRTSNDLKNDATQPPVRAEPCARPHRGASLWGRASDRAGRSVAATLETSEPYRLTVLTALGAVERVLDGQLTPGFTTPARAFGHDFILQFPGTRFEWL